jgi:hypothetical protein
MYVSAQYINIISVISNNMKKKINLHISSFCSAGSWLQFITIDSHTSDHIFSFRCLSQYSFNCYLYKGGLLFTSSISFYMFSTTDSRLTHGIYTVLQLASNYLVASARWQAFHLCQQQFCCLENRSGCNFLVTATEKLQVRALSYKTVLSIPSNKKIDQLKLPVRAWQLCARVTCLQHGMAVMSRPFGSRKYACII